MFFKYFPKINDKYLLTSRLWVKGEAIIQQNMKYATIFGGVMVVLY